MFSGRPRGSIDPQLDAQAVDVARLAFQVISERYDHRRSTCITTNRLFKGWTKVFPDPLNPQVISERLTERAEVFVIDGKKYRDPRYHETT